MSVCGQSGQAEEDSASEEVCAPNRESLYKQKPASKVVRVLTVLAYLLSVSLAAILLSVYYVCVWKSPDLPLEELPPSALQGNTSDYESIPARHTAFHVHGGGDTSVNGEIIPSPPDNTTSGPTNASESTEWSTDPTDTYETTVPLDTTTQGLNDTSDDIGPTNVTDSIT